MCLGCFVSLGGRPPRAPLRRAPATASAEGAQVNGRPFPATASAEGAQLNVPPFPATAWAEGPQLNAAPSPAIRLPVNSCQHPRTRLHQHTAW